MSRRIDDLVPRGRLLAQQLLAECRSRGIEIFVTSTLRTFHEQDELYAQGRSRSGPVVTNAQGGESSHNHGLAFDVAFRSPPAASPFGDDNPWEEVGELGKSLGLEWGGDWTRFPDRPHFQVPSPFSLRTLRAAAIGRFRRGIQAEAEATEQLQRLLDEAGFDPGSADGQFGPRTEAAVQELQRAAGLLPSGIVQMRELDELAARLTRGAGP
ncbi:MAG: M15 family metallopeptidase [Thermoanaerobaculia bacterium]|nr:M15 family metallopeptidase [Thermoanaerobaculia bacterium]